jgi:hypothetical protein
MRTKTLLLAAVLGVAMVATSLAQAIYSVNVVGYVNKTFTNNASFFIVANPLNSGNNTVSTVIPTAPDATTIYRFTSTGGFGQPISFVEGAGWFTPTGPSTDVLAPGEAFFLFIPAGTTLPVTMTFVGEVPQGNLTNPVSIPAGKFSMIASQVPVKAGLGQTIMGFPAADADTVYFFDGAAQAYKAPYSFVEGAGWFQGATAVEPSPEVGEGFFLFADASAPATRTWTRTFNVQ